MEPNTYVKSAQKKRVHFCARQRRTFAFGHFALQCNKTVSLVFSCFSLAFYFCFFLVLLLFFFFFFYKFSFVYFNDDLNFQAIDQKVDATRPRAPVCLSPSFGKLCLSQFLFTFARTWLLVSIPLNVLLLLLERFYSPASNSTQQFELNCSLARSLARAQLRNVIWPTGSRRRRRRRRFRATPMTKSCAVCWAQAHFGCCCRRRRRAEVELIGTGSQLQVSQPARRIGATLDGRRRQPTGHRAQTTLGTHANSRGTHTLQACWLASRTWHFSRLLLLPLLLHADVRKRKFL